MNEQEYYARVGFLSNSTDSHKHCSYCRVAQIVVATFPVSYCVSLKRSSTLEKISHLGRSLLNKYLRASSGVGTATPIRPTAETDD